MKTLALLKLVALDAGDVEVGAASQQNRELRDDVDDDVDGDGGVGNGI